MANVSIQTEANTPRIERIDFKSVFGKSCNIRKNADIYVWNVGSEQVLINKESMKEIHECIGKMLEED